MSRLLHLMAARIATGTVVLATPDGRTVTHHGRGDGPRVEVTVHDPDLARRLVLGGASALGASYVEGGWDTDDLPGLLRLLGASVDDRLRSGLGQQLQAGAGRLFGAVTARWGSEGAVDTMAGHYNLGNDFYGAWLDESMTYSSALFEATGHLDDPRATTPPADGEALARAQRAKYERILDQADVQAGDRVLEIGFGWGGFAELAAQRGAHVTGVTIATEQLDHARRRLAVAGHDDHVDLRLLDFADIPATFGESAFDSVVSIEMIESVDHHRWAELFEVIGLVLRPRGRAVMQVIEIADDLYRTYQARDDFIRTWIFPGGRLPAPRVVRAHAAAAGLAEQGVHAFGPSYARTLASWRRRFEDVFDELRPLGFDDRFRRMWRYYLGYCQAGFELGRIDVAQWTWRLAEPGVASAR